MLHCVITTIQQPTDPVEQLAARAKELNAKVLIIGDRKGPSDYAVAGTEFWPLPKQQESEFEIAGKLPENHYARKNVGYLIAIGRGAECIYESDDDNAPRKNWSPRHESLAAQPAKNCEWLNAYRHFSSLNIWPRGFPLDEVATNGMSGAHGNRPATLTVSAPIQQGLANGSPDVDAIWRLVLDQAVEFNHAPSLWLPPGTWCPFNSQSTWWWPLAYPLMYLPSYCSFRMTDIWRGFIAQRCLWELQCGLVFHAPEVNQQRNPHNLMRDFADEVNGYLRNKELCAILASLELETGTESTRKNLLSCYEALVKTEFFPAEELILVKAWLNDLGALNQAHT